MIENKKSKIWLYAVILFTSAFLVLLFTAYSQIKLSKNLSDYKNQIYNKETEKSKVQQNFSSAQEMNAKLNEDIKNLQNQNDTLIQELNYLKEEKEKSEEELRKTIEASEELSEVLVLYLNGNATEGAKLLKKYDFDITDVKFKEAYKALSTKVNTEAGKLLFDEGYELYVRAKYSEAAEKFLSSNEYAPAETYSDKCLYYLAYAKYREKNNVAAVEYMNKLINDYPSSLYIKRAKSFVNKYKQ